jgi:hypothetical protein
VPSETIGLDTNRVVIIGGTVTPMKILIALMALVALLGCSKNIEKKISLSCKGLLSAVVTQNDGTVVESAPKEVNATMTITYIPVSKSNDTSQYSDVWLIESDNPDFAFVTYNHRSEDDVKHMSVVVDQKNIRVNGSHLTKGYDKTVKVLINRASGEISKQEVNFIPDYTHPQISDYKGICQNLSK